MTSIILVIAPILLALFAIILFRGYADFAVNKTRVFRSVTASKVKPQKRIDYRVYIMSNAERVFYTLLAAGFLFIVSFIFYHSVFVSMSVSILAVFYPKIKSKELLQKRKNVLSMQFRDALYFLASSVSAGKSVETAFKDTVQELGLLYPDTDSYIVREFAAINNMIEMNETIEEALSDFAERSGSEDVRSFTEVFSAGKRSGGNMVDIIINTSNVIGEKLRIKEEINTLLSQRKLEQKILNAMPALLILLLSWSTGDYMAPVFETAFGRMAMTAAVILLTLACFISKKIMDIEV
jgi:tight adherence protein B